MSSRVPEHDTAVDRSIAAAAIPKRYVIVTPVRDEEEHLENTLQAVIAQVIRPERWIIVNDGSSDSTASIAERYAHQHHWITVVHRSDRGARKNGSGVIEAFNEGYKQLQGVEWDFIVKLDGDLTFPPDYVQRCLQEFDRDPSLGVGGGALYNITESGPQFEPHPWFHVRGATKIYRKACWEQIGHLWSGTGWDTIDEVKANMAHWSTRTFPEIHAFHHRMTGAAEGGWRDNVKNGQGSYIAGYHPLYVLARCIRRVRRKPYVVGAVAMLYGFIAARWKQVNRIDDPQVIRFVQAQQLNRLFGRTTVWK